MVSIVFLGAITAQSAGSPPISDSDVLLHFDGANNSTSIVDSSSHSTWTASSGAKLSTDQAMFGPSSLLVNGGYVSTINMGGSFSTSFCIQGWAYNSGGSPRGIFHLYPTSSAESIALGWDGSSQWQLYHLSNVTNSGGTTIPTGWFHWAVYRAAGVIYVAINGHIVINVSDSGSLAAYTSCYIGIYYNSVFPWVGYIDEVQILLSETPYGSSDFTPPTSPFT